MAKNRNTFEKTQRENAKRRKAQEKRTARLRKNDKPASPGAPQTAAGRDGDSASE
jgi:hypothetical protein